MALNITNMLQEDRKGRWQALFKSFYTSLKTYLITIQQLLISLVLFCPRLKKALLHFFVFKDVKWVSFDFWILPNLATIFTAAQISRDLMVWCIHWL